MIELANKKRPEPQNNQEEVWMMKNSLTEQEMDEAGERWANHKGPYMTLAETLAHAAEKAKLRTEKEGREPDFPTLANSE